MSYKLLEVTSYYKKYLDLFYSQHLETQSLSYEDHYKLLLSDCFAECDFIHNELQKLGNNTSFIIYNDDRLQRKSLEFNNDKLDLFDIFCIQLKENKPDVLLISDIMTFSVAQYKIIKELLPNKSKLIGWHFTTVDEQYCKLFAFFDEIYTGSKYVLSLLKPYCKSVQLLYHAFNPIILDKVSNVNKNNSLVFSGSIILNEEAHNNRIDMFNSLEENKIPFECYGEIYGSFVPHTVRQLASFVRHLRIPDYKRYKIERNLKEKIHSPVFGLEYYRTLSNYSVCINQHAKVAGTGAGNMRMFEATGVGTCLLSDYKDENIDLFLPDEEIVVYRNYHELIDKARYLIDHPTEAADIAKRGQIRTLTEHTYEKKAEKLNDYIVQLLKKG